MNEIIITHIINLFTTNDPQQTLASESLHQVQYGNSIVAQEPPNHLCIFVSILFVCFETKFLSEMNNLSKF